MNWGQAGKRNWVGFRVTTRLIDKDGKVGHTVEVREPVTNKDREL